MSREDEGHQLREPLYEGGGFEVTPEQLAEICNLDNHHKKDGEDTILSSDMIVNNFGGMQKIAQMLDTDFKTGIDRSTIKKRQDAFGKNSFPPPKIKSLGELVMENFEDPINKILLGAAVVSMIIGLIQHPFPEGMIEGTSIMIALVIIITVNSGNNYMSEKRLAELVQLSGKQMVPVFRGSTDTETIDATELVVGDLIAYEQGMKIPADCIMVDGQDTVCIEGELTGEPDGVPKTPITQENWQDGVMCTMMAKSLVGQGVGKAIVMAVGTQTVAGVITLKTQAPNQPTHLQEKLETIANKIGNLGIAVAILTFISMVVRISLEMCEVIKQGCGNILVCVENPDIEAYSFSSLENRVYADLLGAVIIAITVVVVAIPEGLPLAVTISLSFSSKQMQKLNNLVRKLASAETMGGATHICSDKTGTLTLNKMTVMAVQAAGKAHMAGKFVTSELVKNLFAETGETPVGDDNVKEMLIKGILWNSSARIETNNDPVTNSKEPFLLQGNVTEQGIIKFFMQELGGQGCIDVRKELTEENTLCIVSFTSKRKRGSIVVRNPEREGTDQEVRVYCKGAPDMVLESTENVIAADGSVVSIEDEIAVPENLALKGEDWNEELTDTYRGLFERTVKNFARQAYRTILVTYKDMSMEEYEALKADNNDFEKEEDRFCLEEGLTAVGVFGLQDPLRDTIIGSIQQCRDAGIRTIMCTGDNIDTAIAISKNALILQEDEEDNEYACMTGAQFREEVGGLKKITVNGVETDVIVNMTKFKKIKRNLRVLARSSPEDKFILCTGIQADEGVVAMTGDGTNDAPALTKADVGFAMGITGTDVAKGASDIILLDDNFSSIVVALRYGRSVYDNVRKFLQFQLTVNVVAMFIVFFGSVIIKDSPLNAVQMLWVNLIMDTFAALALATEPPASDILTRMPYHKDAAIVTEVMWRNVFGHAIYQSIILVLVIFAGANNVLVNEFQVKCLKYEDETNTRSTCLEYNPFYAEGLYYQKKDIDSWAEIEQLFSNDKISYNTEALNNFICYQYKQENGESSSFVCTDEIIAGNKDKYTPSKIEKGAGTQKLLLFTYVFQIFVFMQVFNQINARKIELGEMNVFAGFFNNWLFIGVTLFTVVIQMVMVEIGGVTVKCCPLDNEQNMLCLAIGAGELLWGLLIKFMPLKLFQCVSLDDKPMQEDQKQSALTSTFKKQRTMKVGGDSSNYKRIN